MTYAISAALQTAVFDVLTSDPALATLIGPSVFDALPSGTVPEIYVSLGDERVEDASDQLGHGAVHKLNIFVRTTLPGFAKAKAVAGAVCDALHDVQLPLARGRLIFLRFERADARRIDSNTTREILLRFRARVEDE